MHGRSLLVNAALAAELPAAGEGGPYATPNKRCLSWGAPRQSASIVQPAWYNQEPSPRPRTGPATSRPKHATCAARVSHQISHDKSENHEQQNRSVGHRLLDPAGQATGAGARSKSDFKTRKERHMCRVTC